MDYRDVLDFWFGGDATEGGEAAAIDRQSALWWGKDAASDAEIRARFGGAYDDAIAGRLDPWFDVPRGRLALIIVIDQFSRTLFRDDARAFAHDARARALCLDGLRIGADHALRPVERVFMYLPLEHSEALEDQERSVMLMRTLYEQVTPSLQSRFESYLNFARRHREIIVRFGRFPHRNAALGRASTPEEAAFLLQPGSAF